MGNVFLISAIWSGGGQQEAGLVRTIFAVFRTKTLSLSKHLLSFYEELDTVLGVREKYE